jgi:DNA (cytosine-5)-methyltransferase 1
MNNQKKDKPTFIDLFSGCGGMSLGFEMAGFQPILAIDNWSDALRTYQINNPGVPVLQADLMSLEVDAVARDCPRPTMIIGGPPCQGFSISGKRDPNDPRNQDFS